MKLQRLIASTDLNSGQRLDNVDQTNLERGSHHHQVAILVLDDKLNYFGQLENAFFQVKNGLAFYLGPVLPPRTDGSSLGHTILSLKPIFSEALSLLSGSFDNRCGCL